jgi:hypothetical protein
MEFATKSSRCHFIRKLDLPVVVILRGDQPRCQRVSLEENLQLEQCDRQDVERPEARTGEACLPGARSVRRGTRWTKGNRSCPHGSLPAHQCRVAGVVGSWLLGADTEWVDAPQQERRCLGCLAVPDGPEVVA